MSKSKEKLYVLISMCVFTIPAFLCSVGILGSTVKSLEKLMLKTEQIIMLSRKLLPVYHKSSE